MRKRNIQDLYVDNLSMDDLILIQSDLQILERHYSESGIKVTDWIIDNLDLVRKEIKERQSAEIKRQLRVAKLRRENLRTADEKRTDLDREIAELEGKL